MNGWFAEFAGYKSGEVIIVDNTQYVIDQFFTRNDGSTVVASFRIVKKTGKPSKNSNIWFNASKLPNKD